MSNKGWAIVTGASGGLGAAFSGALSVRRYAVFAVGRTAAPLARVAEEGIWPASLSGFDLPGESEAAIVRSSVGPAGGCGRNGRLCNFFLLSH